MITREEYLKALEVIEKYHEQIKVEVNKWYPIGKEELISINNEKDLFNISSAKEGDCITLVRSHGRMKFFTIGNSYKVIRVRKPNYRGCSMLQILNDVGDLCWVSSGNKYKSWNFSE